MTQPTQEEEILRRKSAPQPTMTDGMVEAANLPPAPLSELEGQIDFNRAEVKPIGLEQIQKASLILNRYKSGKTNLEQKIVGNEEWYKLRNWEVMRKSRTDMVEPTSAWLFNAISNKHAEAMDNAPTCNILPREEDDKQEAEMLSDILPVVLSECDFESVYDAVTLYKLKHGTGVYGVFWDAQKLNGLGDIAITKIDLLNLFWQPGITDIQNSRNVFLTSVVDNDTLVDTYPELKMHLSGTTFDITKYIYDDTVDTSDSSVVVDWYYKKRNSQGKTVLHYVKYVNDVVLFATENEPDYAEVGLYQHAMYPFFFDTLFPMEGSPAGFGYIDVGKSAQEYIDRGNQAIMQSLLANARPRYFMRADGSVNEDDFTDLTKPIVKVDGTLGQDSIIPIKGNPLNGVYVNVIDAKINELKETTSNRDVANGGTEGGATAASAIAAMQESAGKASRDSTKASYRTFKGIVTMCIELIRQFYTLPRCFRIMGKEGEQKFIYYSNQNLQEAQQEVWGEDMGVRLPVFDVEVVPQKASAYTKMAQNELALQFYQLGFFNPQGADQALAVLDMMDFDRKPFVEKRIREQGTMMQTLMMLAQSVDALQGSGTMVQEQIAQQFGMATPQGNAEVDMQNLGDNPAESTRMQRARQQAAETTSPT